MDRDDIRHLLKVQAETLSYLLTKLAELPGDDERWAAGALNEALDETNTAVQHLEG